ncbi:MAG: MoaD/ThiS family protein [Nitrospinales bacterium]
MITVKYFAGLKTIAGSEEDRFDLGSETTLRALDEAIGKVHPELKNLIRERKVMVSVNHDVASPDSTIKDGDEVALLPPFSGGSR